MPLEPAELELLRMIKEDARGARQTAEACRTSIATLDARTLDHERETIKVQDELSQLRASFDTQLADVRKEARSQSTKVGAPIAGLGLILSMIKDALSGT